MKRIILLIIPALLALSANKPAVATTDAFEPLLGEMKWVAFNFAPRGWAKCDGQLLSINQNQSLFSLLGTTYGGDGRTSFALPDLRGRVMLHEGTGAGLSTKQLGYSAGEEAHQLTIAELPSHNHNLMATNNIANSTTPESAVIATQARSKYFTTQAGNEVMHPSAISHTGSSAAHNNMAPTNTLTCIIALVGVYPSRS